MLLSSHQLTLQTPKAERCMIDCLQKWWQLLSSLSAGYLKIEFGNSSNQEVGWNTHSPMCWIGFGLNECDIYGELMPQSFWRVSCLPLEPCQAPMWKSWVSLPGKENTQSRGELFCWGLPVLASPKPSRQQTHWLQTNTVRRWQIPAWPRPEEVSSSGLPNGHVE